MCFSRDAYVLDRVLIYEIDQIKIVEPTQTEDLAIVSGEDYCTLLTCTPYGVNTHRLLVRGSRIENVEEHALYIDTEAYRIDSLILAPVVAAPMLLILFIILLVKYRKKRSDLEDGK
jgi:sortase A